MRLQIWCAIDQLITVHTGNLGVLASARVLEAVRNNRTVGDTHELSYGDWYFGLAEKIFLM